VPQHAVGGVPSKMVGASRLVGSLIFSLELLSTAFFLARLAPALPRRWLSSLLGTACITVSMLLHWRCAAHPFCLHVQLSDTKCTSDSWALAAASSCRMFILLGRSIQQRNNPSLRRSWVQRIPALWLSDGILSGR